MTSLPSLGPRGEGWVLVQGILFVLVVAAGVSLGGAWSGEARTVTTVFGVVLIAVGGVLAFRGVVDLRDALTPVPRPRVGAQLVETGSYALARHPIYGGIVIAALGWGLFTASPIAVGLSVVLLGFFRLKSAREEAWLLEAYPGYEAYRARTKRMIPFLY
ncbi:MAG TPA: isoprenylcysteine carboxylmethyltransferase family protein [Candidatus Limnocylindrales bacterium]|nr:isoprenylcysteine carboxylmethyltransferase family protein [Candidatus Limnocylindrales bacterium]